MVTWDINKINMITELKMRQHNKQVYLEIQKDLEKKGNGLFSFVLKLSSGDIVDYVIMENLSPDSFVEIFDEQGTAQIHS